MSAHLFASRSTLAWTTLACAALLNACSEETLDSYGQAQQKAEAALKDAKVGTTRLVNDKTAELIKTTGTGEFSSGGMSLTLREDHGFALQGALDVYHLDRTDRANTPVRCRVALGGQLKFGDWGVKEEDYIYVNTEGSRFQVQEAILHNSDDPYNRGDAQTICRAFLDESLKDGISGYLDRKNSDRGVLRLSLDFQVGREIKKSKAGFASVSYRYSGSPSSGNSGTFTLKDEAIDIAQKELPKLAGDFEPFTIEMVKTADGSLIQGPIRKDPSSMVTIAPRLGQISVTNAKCGISALLEIDQVYWLNGKKYLKTKNADSSSAENTQTQVTGGCSPWQRLLKALSNGASYSESGTKNDRSIYFGTEAGWLSIIRK